MVEDMVARSALPAVIVNPSTPVGPRDIRPTPTGRVILEAARGKMPGYVDTGLNLVHVDDVARSCVAALSRGAVGERHILGGFDVPLGELLAHIAAPPRTARAEAAAPLPALAGRRRSRSSGPRRPGGSRC